MENTIPELRGCKTNLGEARWPRIPIHLFLPPHEAQVQTSLLNAALSECHSVKVSVPSPSTLLLSGWPRQITITESPQPTMCRQEYKLHKYACGSPSTKEITHTTGCKKPGSDACEQQKKNGRCIATIQHPRCGTCSTCDHEKTQKSVRKSKKQSSQVVRDTWV
jgi:hypothetical protein